MAYYRLLGEVPPKRHTQHRRPDGGLYYEELMGEEGFSSDSSLLYHRHPPSAIIDASAWELPDLATVANHPLRPRHLRLHELFPGEEWKRHDVVTGRRLVLGNGDVRISYVAAGEASPLYRNALGDECVYVESGEAVVETVFGALPAPAGRLRAAAAGDHAPLVAAGRGAAAGVHHRGQQPHRARPPLPVAVRAVPGARSLLRAGPARAGRAAARRGHRGEVLVKHRGRAVASSAPGWCTPHHPFDVVGWDGCLYPYTFNIADFEPITGRVHQPPPAHQVFEGTNFVICNFVPRKVDYHPLAIPVPYYHSNVDSDEVMFYCGGDYEARKGSGIGQGSISLHPGGHAHGPQPGAYERSIGVEFFDELAVMVDTFRPLELGEGGRACEDPGYAWTWSGRGPV